MLPAKKSRPTRSRAEAEAARKRPLVPEDRRAAAKAAREQARVQRDLEYEAMKTGDESRMPYRDRGRVRRYIRDYVDSRYNIGEYFLFIALGFLVLTLFTQLLPAQVVIVGLVAMYLTVILAIADGFLLWRRLKKQLIERFGDDAVMQRGLAMYAVMRAFQIRKARLPKPMIKHGEPPRL